MRGRDLASKLGQVETIGVKESQGFFSPHFYAAPESVHTSATHRRGAARYGHHEEEAGAESKSQREEAHDLPRQREGRRGDRQKRACG